MTAHPKQNQQVQQIVRSTVLLCFCSALGCAHCCCAPDAFVTACNSIDQPLAPKAVQLRNQHPRSLDAQQSSIALQRTAATVLQKHSRCCCQAHLK